MWVARDKDGTLCLFIDKPMRGRVQFGANLANHEKFVEIDNKLFPELKWEDEPEEVFLVMKNTLHKITCSKCGKEFKYHNSDIKEWHDCQPSSGYDFGADYVNCPHCEGYNELSSW